MSTDINLRIIFNNFFYKSKELLIFFYSFFYIFHKSGIKIMTEKKWNE